MPRLIYHNVSYVLEDTFYQVTFMQDILLCRIHIVISHTTPWRNGSASDSRSEGCVFESRRGHIVFYIILSNLMLEKYNILQAGFSSDRIL